MPKDLLLEIGTEELPAAFLPPALDELARRMGAALTEARLEHGAVSPLGTPRRLAVRVSGVADRQPDVSKDVTGPPARAAFDAEGRPTKAALGFAKGQGVDPASLQVVETDKGAYVAAHVEEAGRAAEELLPELLARLVRELPFRKSMRWGEVDETFARPVHWICALFGEEVLRFGFADVTSDRTTRGHRFLAPDPIALKSPAEYVERLEEVHVLVDPEVRRERIRLLAEQALAEAGDGRLRLREDAELLDEVRDLVELPVPVVGAFDPAYLELPSEVLVSEMREHQRYFSVEDGEGRLAPRFVAVSNTPVRDPEVSRRGYEWVLAARLADARYFWDTDRQRPLADRVAGLDRVVFQQKLGSIGDKVERVRALALWLASRLELETEQATVGRVATLAKADLVTGMVGEFPDLQGTMGRYYAEADGEPAAVALGIEEHYLPRHAGDRLPSAHPGAVVGLADRLDTLVGIFGIGKQPTGAADPFALRRACLAIIHVLLDRGYRLSLGATVDQALRLLEPALTVPSRQTREAVLEFFRGRLKNLWEGEHAADVVEAVLSAGFDDVVGARQRIRALTALKAQPEFRPLAEAFTRAANIVAKAPSIDAGEVDASLFEHPSEEALWKRGMTLRGRVEEALASHDYDAALAELATLREPVAALFDGVLVMAEDVRVRDNRLLLLAGVADLFSRIADFSKIQTES